MGPRQTVCVVLLAQLVLFVLFCVFTVYSQKYEPERYAMFQDVHVMIFIGFGFLMVFLKRYGYSSIGFTFLVGALISQWAMLCEGFYDLNENYKIEVGLENIYRAEIAVATVLISMGAVLGRTSYLQLLVMGFIEIAFFSANSYLGSDIFKVADAGDTIFVHTFGAYFGLAVSYVINRKKEGSENAGVSLAEANYTSDLLAMIGTVFLWLYWPSFNSIELKGDDQHRAIINTYLSLVSCCASAFCFSILFNHERKFDMVHIQNSTLAGGVAVGASANLMLQPFGAIIIGIIAAAVSVFGYCKITPKLEKSCNIPDTCGVHNLHGMPGVLGGLVGAIMAGMATEEKYNASLYDIYPARASPTIVSSSDSIQIAPGDGRSAGQQAGYQVIAVIVTMAIAVVSGLITGLILRCSKFSHISAENHYDDATCWVLPEELPPTKRNSVVSSRYDNAAFEMSANGGGTGNPYTVEENSQKY